MSGLGKRRFHTRHSLLRRTSSRTNWMTCLGAIGLLALGCGGESNAGGGQRQRPPTAVSVLELAGQVLPDVVQTVGTLEAPERTTISAEMDEQIVKIAIPEGEKVEAGELLVQLDDTRARATLEGVRARVANTKARMRRLEELRKSSVSSQQAYDDAVEASADAIADLADAEASLEKTRILAPFSGIAGLSLVTPGQFVRSGAPIVELTRVDPLDLLFSVPQRYAGALSVGQKVLGHASNCSVRFQGIVRAIEPRIDRNTRTVSVKARVPNPTGELWTGMAASVRVVLREIPDAIRIPREALIRETGRYFVYVVDADAVAQQRTVELGTFFSDSVQVTRGLAPGDRVVVTGHQRLRPNSPTQPSPYQALDNPTLELGWEGPPDGCGD